MTFLAPWALALGALGAAGLVVLHLVARQRPSAFPLPTARFIPDRRTLVRRVTARPRDLSLLALRVLLVLSAAAAFARPVLAPRGGALARVILLDLSSSVADPADAVARARAIIGDDVRTALVLFDSAARPAVEARAVLDSLARSPASTRPVGAGALAAALLSARRHAAEISRGADSVELVIVSPVARGEVGVALDSARAMWPGAVRVERLAARSEASSAWAMERPLGRDDPLAPALSRAPVSAPGGGAVLVRLLRRAPAPADSAFASRGNAVVHWDTTGLLPPAGTALTTSGDVVVATLGRDAPGARTHGGRVVARWLDGEPAATESDVGGGCIRTVRVGLPPSGDLPLRSAFQRVARSLLGSCGGTAVHEPADSLAVARLTGSGGAARAADLRGGSEARSRVAPWLLGFALACALGELLMRACRGTEAA